jgi:hypothetical protein
MNNPNYRGVNPERWQPGGDKYESIKLDEQMEKAELARERSEEDVE